MFGNVLGIARCFASGPDIRIAQKLEALKRALSRRLGKTKPDAELWKADFAWCRISCGPYPSPMPVSRIVRIGFEPRYLAVENLVDRKAYARALKSKSFSKKSLSLIACRMPKPPMTPDDINALSKAWNESKAATDAVLAKFREGASKDEIDDAIRKMYATRGKVQEFHDKFFEN